MPYQLDELRGSTLARSRDRRVLTGDTTFVECSEFDILIGLGSGELLVASQLRDGQLRDRWLVHKEEPLDVLARVPPGWGFLLTLAMTGERRDTWAAGELYEPYVGRWSRRVAREFLAWLQPPADLDWLDVGCGTGAVTQIILDEARPRSVNGVDSSAGFIAHARAHVTDPRATFDVADAQWLPMEPGRFGAAVAGLVLNFVPTPLLAVREMARTVRPGGLVAAYVWDYAGKMELMRYFWDAAIELDRAALELDEGRRFPLCQPEALIALFTQAGLRAIGARPIDIPTPFRDFDDYWTPFLGGQAPAPGYAMSLGEERRTALRERIRARLPMARDGSIDLVARAWAVRGRTAEDSSS
jgi:SAM-dependent methyltransferase